MSLFGGLFAKKREPTARDPEGAVIIHLDAVKLPQEIYDEFDLSTLEERLVATLDGAALGSLDGNEIGEGTTTLYLYGPDAEKLFATVEPVLREYPLCRHATVIIRKGEPVTEQREVRL